MPDKKSVAVLVKKAPWWQGVLLGAGSAIIGGLVVNFLLMRRRKGE